MSAYSRCPLLVFFTASRSFSLLSLCILKEYFILSPGSVFYFTVVNNAYQRRAKTFQCNFENISKLKNLGIRGNDTSQVLTIIRKSFLTNAVFIPAYSSWLLLVFSIASRTISLLSLCILKEYLILPPGSVFFADISVILKIYQDWQICQITSENVKKHSFFEILSPQTTLLVLSFPSMKSGNIRRSKFLFLIFFRAFYLKTNGP